MVQMKLLMKVCLMSSSRLYIPHGSDETPDTLQKIYCEITFISHMVQMKPIRGDNCYTPHCKLYIPHGSDETLLNSK